MKVAICDATEFGRSLWSGQLYGIEERYEIPMEIDQYENTDQLLFHLEDRKSCPDLLLLDVNVPGIDGISAAKKIREMQMQIEIIFLTTDPHHWPDAFDVDAIHYLIKGETTPDRIEQVIMKAVQRIGAAKENYFSFSCAGEDRIIPIRHIRYFSADRRIVSVHYGPGNQVFEFYTSFGKLENKIFNRGFIRVHKSYIVSMRAIRSMSLRGGVLLTSGELLPAGRTYFDKAKEVYDEYQQRNEKP